jgi:hypothetical protein
VLVIGKTINFTVMPQYRFPAAASMKPFRLRHDFMTGGRRCTDAVFVSLVAASQ